MVETASLKIVQIVVDTGDENYCAVALPQDRKDILLSFIQTLSEGPIKLVRLPGVKMIPIKDMQP